jgi:hypothetical protein
LLLIISLLFLSIFLLLLGKEISCIVQSNLYFDNKTLHKNLTSVSEKALVAILTPYPVHVPSSIIQIANAKGVR